MKKDDKWIFSINWTLTTQTLYSPVVRDISWYKSKFEILAIKLKQWVENLSEISY